ncbi:protein twisted gastrulation-like [Tropilaelaps mercedesae]|uniref:Protein twisted gastrulation-like n=1 Tax=Tropilaelaps mercedesae TaxID=418985 RepID=A0A1V9XF92_9ACAR|nr:protein twisted gastrulation-like [Tropilaelaps mercedesae]
MVLVGPHPVRHRFRRRAATSSKCAKQRLNGGQQRATQTGWPTDRPTGMTCEGVSAGANPHRRGRRGEDVGSNATDRLMARLRVEVADSHWRPGSPMAADSALRACPSLTRGSSPFTGICTTVDECRIFAKYHLRYGVAPERERRSERPFTGGGSSVGRRLRMACRSRPVLYFIGCVVVACVCFYTQTVSSAEAVKQALPHGCNESVCGSVVSKCLLTQSCKCGPDPVRNNITCAKDCFYCLDYLYTDCCSCVDVCRKDNREFSLSQKSNVEDLPDPMPELFQMLMESVDISQGRWSSLSFPAHHTVIGLNKDIHFVSIIPHPVGTNGSIDSTPSPININPTYDSNAKSDDVNCTVAFMKSCLSLNKCRENCMSLGATSYR